jgi:hypothetical protein
MSKQNERKSPIDGKFVVAVLALAVALMALFYGAGQCKDRQNSPPWMTPALNIVCANPTVTSPPPISTIPPSPGSTMAEPTNWAVTFDYRLPLEAWSVGLHQYTLTSKCPGEEYPNATNSFTVSDNYESLPGDVYLRWAGLRKSKTYGAEPVEGINPSQSTLGVVTWDQITKSQAEWRAANCSGTITWDGGTPQPLTAQTQFQH